MRNKKKFMHNSNHAITLISLVITIIILIILAGVAVNLSLGENGLFTRAKHAKEKTAEAQAREKLEIVLNEELIKRAEKSEYNDNELNAILEGKGFTVAQNLVTVDGYNFIIDREKLIILNSLGEDNVSYTAELKKYKNSEIASILLTVQSNIKIVELEVLNPDGSINIKMSSDKNIITKDMDVELDKEYIINVTIKNGKTITKKLVKKLDDPVSTLNEFLAFRDAVNSGITYEGKTLKLNNDIDLSSVCGEGIGNWTPIGNSTNKFKGTFDGNYKNIKNVYIKLFSTNEQALFKYNNGTIKNLYIDGNIIANESNIAILVSINEGTIQNVTTNGKVEGWNYTGAISGKNLGTIEGCVNNAEVIPYGWNGYYGRYFGGITGGLQGKIEKCINNGDVYGNWGVGGIAGISEHTSEIKSSINKGKITGRYPAKSNKIYIGGVLGWSYSRRNYNRKLY